MAYDHGAFRVRNLDDAIAFYTGKLGFRFLFDGKNEKAAERYAFLDHNGARLELIETEHETYRPSMPEPPFCPHLCFEAENMDSVLKMLRENELTILDGPNEILYAAKHTGAFSVWFSPSRSRHTADFSQSRSAWRPA